MSNQFSFKQFSLAWVRSLNVKTVLFQVIQFSINTQFSSIWYIDRALLGALTLDQSEPGNDGNEEVLRIPQNSSIIGTTPSERLVSYPGHSLGWGWGVLPLCREADGLFYSPSWLGNPVQSGPESEDNERVLSIP